MAVLHKLSQESEPVSMKVLLSDLGDTFPERSVRRWINELISEGIVEKIGKKKGTKYRILILENRQNHILGNYFSEESKRIIEAISSPLFQRIPVAYSDDWLNDYIPNKTYFLSTELRGKLLEAGKRSQNNDPAGTYARKIFNRLLIDLSYNSSRLGKR